MDGSRDDKEAEGVGLDSRSGGGDGDGGGPSFCHGDSTESDAGTLRAGEEADNKKSGLEGGGESDALEGAEHDAPPKTSQAGDREDPPSSEDPQSASTENPATATDAVVAADPDATPIDCSGRETLKKKRKPPEQGEERETDEAEEEGRRDNDGKRRKMGAEAEPPGYPTNEEPEAAASGGDAPRAEGEGRVVATLTPSEDGLAAPQGDPPIDDAAATAAASPVRTENEATESSILAPDAINLDPVTDNQSNRASSTEKREDKVHSAPSPPSPQDATADNNEPVDDAVSDGVDGPRPSTSSEYERMRWRIVSNDGSSASMIKLVGLKSLFSKQLPKMPKAYIARLVLDPRHSSLAILSDNPDVRDSDDEIIGGITYRAFSDMRFAEIAFCAVNSAHQVKGYGTRLMNLLKSVAAASGIEYFITYADNYAIGYFRKQGFTKSISMPKGRYTGLIKEYDGGTPMECYVHPSIDFTRVDQMLEAQRAAILQHVRERSKSAGTAYPPLHLRNQLQSEQIDAMSSAPTPYAPSAAPLTEEGARAASGTDQNPGEVDGTSNAGERSSSAEPPITNLVPGVATAVAAVTRGTNPVAARILAVPGIVQAGWTLQDVMAALGGGAGVGNGGGTSTGTVGSGAGYDGGMATTGGLVGTGRAGSGRGGAAGGGLRAELLSAVRKIHEQHFSWPFREPVDTAGVPDYLEVIKEPIDLSTIEKRIRADYYRSRKMLYADLILMVNNCKLYNDESSTYVQCALAVEKMITTSLFADVLAAAAPSDRS